VRASGYGLGMCDENTEADNDAYLARRPPEGPRLNRRAMGLGAGAAVAVVLAGCSDPPPAKPPLSAPAREPAPEPRPEPTSGSGMPTKHRIVTVDTPDGQAEAFFVSPKEGKHPGVILWPDVAGLRKAYETMATRLASAGYAVLAVNCYYRSSKLPILTEFSQWRSAEGKAKIAPMRKALTHEAIAKDGTAYAAWLDQQPEVDTASKLATMGYCMGGPFTFWTAAAVPDRVGAVASFHGGGLVSDKPASPHKLLSTMKAAALICIAQNDHERQPDGKPALEKAASDSGTPAEIEVYPANHGWCAIDSPVYDETQAERAWARMLAIYGEHL
jgi:carboxymethylenebutenolidase